MYLNIINNIESNLSNESKNILFKKYNELYYNMIDHKNNVHHVKKIINTNLDEDINKIMFTNYPQYNSLKKNINNENQNEQSNNSINIQNDVLVSKNMNLRDIEEVKEDKKNKKINAFANFVSYKKKESIKEIESEKINQYNSIENENIINENENIIKENKNKSVIDYYNNENINNSDTLKNIIYKKK